MISKIIAKTAGELIRDIGNVAENFVTTQKDKARFKQMLSETVLRHTVKLAELQADVLKTEMSGNWLQRSWRPIIMLSFGFIIVYRYFLCQVFSLPAIDLPDGFWNLLEIGLGGYVIGRSVEKVSDRVTKNIDISQLRRRDRKERMKP